MELSITGTNAITYPVMHVWDWRVAIYLFLGGLAGGLMTMSAINYLRPGRKGPMQSFCCWQIPVMAPVLLSIGLFFLWLDLERKLARGEPLPGEEGEKRRRRKKKKAPAGGPARE